MNIDRKKIDYCEEMGYCTECKVYHNERVYITIRSSRFGEFFNSKCYKCLYKKIDNPDKLKLNKFKKQYYLFNFDRHNRIDVLLSDPFTYAIMYYKDPYYLNF